MYDTLSEILEAMQDYGVPEDEAALMIASTLEIGRANAAARPAETLMAIEKDLGRRQPPFPDDGITSTWPPRCEGDKAWLRIVAKDEGGHTDD
jgi:hypothetical protein